MLPGLLVAVLATGVPGVGEAYLERYFEMHPSRATSEGRHDHDSELEDFSAERVEAWAQTNRQTRVALLRLLPEAGDEDRIDAEVLLRQVEQELFDLEVRRRPERDPLLWTGTAANAVVFLLMRADAPEHDRLAAAEARALLIPRLVEQARSRLGATPPGDLAPELCRLAARQASRAAVFYREGLSAATADAATRERLAAAGQAAAAALEALSGWLEELATRSSGSPRLGEDYAPAFRLATDSEPASVLRQAENDLRRLRGEIAAWGRSVWSELLPGEAPPAGEAELVRRLFVRVEEDRDTDLAEYVEGWRRNARELADFVRREEIVTLRDPVRLRIDTAPAFFVGQSVGGVYSPGPWSPDSDTFLFLPTPAPDATPDERDALFRAFNRPFNAMIAAHELIPGHYLQQSLAAHQERRLRSVFSDAVFVEGWGTFCERLLLDAGWGGPLARAAHLKKQLENVARTIVDIRYHTRDLEQAEAQRFLAEEALQDPQLAANMWVRTQTSAPQLVSYYMGDREIQALYQEVRERDGEAFFLRHFTDSMLSLGSVPVRYHRERLLKGQRRLERRLLRGSRISPDAPVAARRAP